MSTVLDLFAGVGWHLGARALGIEEEGVEIMKEAVATRDAIGAKTVHDDVWTYDYKRGAHEGHIDSPPCQTFSPAGKGAGRKALDVVLAAIRSGAWRTIPGLRELEAAGDPRTALVLMPLHAWWIERPEWLAWEQVPTVQPVWDACAGVLREMGYSVWTGRLQAEQYGVPQTRKRSILIASRVREVSAPKPTHSRYYSRSPQKLDEGVEKWMSMAEALGWGAGVLRTGVNTATVGPGAKRDRMMAEGRWRDCHKPQERGSEYPSPTVTSQTSGWLFAGAGATAVDTAGQVRRTLDEPAHTITGKGTAAWVYRSTTMANSARRSLEQPAPTIAFGHDANSARWVREEPLPEWAHNRPSTTIVGTFKPEIVAAPGYRTTNAEGSVRVSVAEAGLLQSFPADMPWQGAKGKQYLQVGNAVPPGLAIPVLGEAAGLDWESVNADYRAEIYG